MKTVKLTNLACKKSEAEERVEKLNERFGGKTYMQLEFVCWPVGGSFDVGVKGIAETEQELSEMVLSLFADSFLWGPQ